MRTVLPIVMIALLLAAPRAQAASATASCWGYGGSDGQTLLPTASAHFHGSGPDFPGYTDGTAHTRLGWMDATCTMFGCGTNAPFQQVCNQGGASGDWSDLVTVSANAPNGTPVDVRVTLELDGTIDGTGGYSYLANGAFAGQLRSIIGT